MDDTPVVKALAELVHRKGTQIGAGLELNVTSAYISQILNGTCGVPEWMGNKLGYTKVWIKTDELPVKPQKTSFRVKNIH